MFKFIFKLFKIGFIITIIFIIMIVSSLLLSFREENEEQKPKKNIEFTAEEQKAQEEINKKSHEFGEAIGKAIAKPFEILTGTEGISPEDNYTIILDKENKTMRKVYKN